MLQSSFRSAPCTVSGEGVSLEVVKKAEKEECVIIRLVETDGRDSSAMLNVADHNAKLISTNLIEWEDGDMTECSEPIRLQLKPFEIQTYKICRRT